MKPTSHSLYRPSRLWESGPFHSYLGATCSSDPFLSSTVTVLSLLYNYSSYNHYPPSVSIQKHVYHNHHNHHTSLHLFTPHARYLEFILTTLFIVIHSLFATCVLDYLELGLHPLRFPALLRWIVHLYNQFL